MSAVGRVLVTGATGRQGGAVARHLRARGIGVRALTRRPGSEAARRLGALGAEVVAGDLLDPASLAPALGGVDAVFSVQDFYAPGGGPEGEVRQGANLAAAAARAGVRVFVQSTMAAATTPTGVPHFDSKFAIERHVDALGLPRVFLGTVWFMDNLFDPRSGGARSLPALRGTLGGDRPFEVLAVDDVGAVAAAVLAAPERHLGTRIDLAGDRLTVDAMRRTYRDVLGRRAPAYPVPPFLLRRLSPEFAAQLRWHRDVGWSFPLAPARALHPGMRSFRAFLEEHRARLV